MHILYPKRCPLCDEVIGASLLDRKYPICAACKNQAEYAREPVCKKCGKPLEDEREEFCLDCGRKEHLFTQGKALWVHKGIVRTSIYRLKYGNRREYGLSYAQELAKAYGPWVRRKGVEAIVPIPLHRSRYRHRGYNQAEIIARELGRILSLPVYPDLLVRSRDTKPQKELNDKERKNNVKRAFKIGENKVQLSCILLVDDIFTTGSTIDGASAALRGAGISDIYFLTVSIGRGY